MSAQGKVTGTAKIPVFPLGFIAGSLRACPKRNDAGP